MIEILRDLLHFVQNNLRLLADPHKDHAFHRVVLVHDAKLPEAWGVPDFHFGQVMYVSGNSVVRSQHDVADVLEVTDQTQSANVVKLAALEVKATSGVGVVVGQLLKDLRYGHAVRKQFVRIQKHLILHGGTAQARIIGHALKRAVTPVNHPILDGLEILGDRSGLCRTYR